MKHMAKKSLAWVLVLMMVVSVMAIMPISANETSPVKAYADAKDGELLYTANFNGDSVFDPKALGGSAANMNYIVSQDGKELTIKAKDDAPASSNNQWGAAIEVLEANKTTFYSIKYLVKANGDDEGSTNNSIGVGGWYVDASTVGKHYNNYANHNTSTLTNRRSSISYGSSKIATDQKKDSGTYVYWNNSAKNNEIGNYKVDANGFVTMLMEFDGTKGTMSAYVLKATGTTGYTEDQWICIEKDVAMTYGIFAETPSTAPEYMGFSSYAYYNTVDTTIKNFEIYRGTVYGHNNIKVNNADELVALGETIATRGESEIAVELTADIDMTGKAFTPIATDKAIRFNGKNFAIKNLTIGVSTAGVDNAGLFATVGAGSSFANLKMENVAIYGKNAASALIGNFQSYGDLSFYNVKVTGTVTSLEGYAGSFIGMNTPGAGKNRMAWEFKYCVNEATVNGDGSAGGFIGYMKGGAEYNVSYCANKGNITVTNTDDARDEVGGFLGGSWHNGLGETGLHQSFKNWYNVGTLKLSDAAASWAMIGGIAGDLRQYQKENDQYTSTFIAENCYDASTRVLPMTADANHKNNAFTGHVANGETKTRGAINCFAVGESNYSAFWHYNSGVTPTLDCTGFAETLESSVLLTTGPATVKLMIEKIDAAIAELGELEMPRGSFADGKERDYTWYYAEGALVAKGTEAAPYEIADAKQYAALVALSTGYQDAAAVGGVEGKIDFTGKYFKLTGDIDMTGYELLPVGGDFPIIVFDGNGKSISNVTMTGANVALFGKLGVGSAISNLTLKNITINATNSGAVLVASSKAGVSFYNVKIEDTCTVTSTGATASGFIADLNDSTTAAPTEGTDTSLINFRYCVNAAAVSGANNVSGFIGNGSWHANSNFEYCINKGTLTATSATGHNIIGGLVGQLNRTSSAAGQVGQVYHMMVKNCLNTGKIVSKCADAESAAPYIWVGGFFGVLRSNTGSTLTMIDCYDNSEHEMTAASNADHAAIAGNADSEQLSKTANYCYGLPVSGSYTELTEWNTSKVMTSTLEMSIVIDSADSKIMLSNGNRVKFSDRIAALEEAVANLAEISNEGEPTTPPDEPGDTTEPTDPGASNAGNDTTAAAGGDTTAAAEEEGGCGSSVVAMYVVIALTAVIALAFVAKKRED